MGGRLNPITIPLVVWVCHWCDFYLLGIVVQKYSSVLVKKFTLFPGFQCRQFVIKVG